MEGKKKNKRHKIQWSCPKWALVITSAKIITIIRNNIWNIREFPKHKGIKP